MEYKKKNGKIIKRLCVTMDGDVYDQFMRHIEDNGYDASKIIEKMVIAFNRNRSEDNGE